MDTTVAILGVIITTIGTLFVVMTLFEFTKLRKLRQDFESFESRIRKEQFAREKAAHRIMASYRITDIDQRIALLQSAIDAHPDAFNAFNSLGYAFVEKGYLAAAIDAFTEAVQRHPDAKEGYFDLAGTHLTAGSIDLCIKYLILATKADPTSKGDICDDKRFSNILTDPRLKRAVFD
ncbi:MAG: tetratricopeptide repeat protein [Magnetococcus sp. THC-1_WYH]